MNCEYCGRYCGHLRYEEDEQYPQAWENDIVVFCNNACYLAHNQFPQEPIAYKIRVP